MFKININNIFKNINDKIIHIQKIFQNRIISLYKIINMYNIFIIY